MISTPGNVAAGPPLGAMDAGGQVVDVLALSRKLASLGYEGDVSTGRFADQPECDQAAGVFVLSSRHEPVGMTALEARASGTPTVVRVHDTEWYEPWNDND